MRRFRCVHCGGSVGLDRAGQSNLRCPRCNTAFLLDDGIVVLANATDDRDYPAALVDLVVSVEQRHFWFAARNEVILSTIRGVIGPLPGTRVLDIGCGTGFVTAALEGAGMDAWGIDMHRAALRRARARMRGPLFSSHTPALPFFPDFDIATMFDVIEHLDDDVEAVREAAAVLEPNGHIVVTVPAGPAHWTSYDEVIGHKRRYDRDSLTGVLRRAGLEIRAVTYFSCVPLLAQIAQRWLAPARRPSQDDTVEVVRHALRIPPEPLNTLFRWSSFAEKPLRSLRWVRGGSLIAVARR